MKRLFFSVAMAALAFSSCKKSSGDEQKAITKENVIGTYKLSSYKIAEQDFMQLMETCQIDDQYSFKAGDILDITDAGVQCDPIGSGSSTWSLDGDILSIGALEESGKVTALTSSTLEITETTTIQGISVSTKLVFTRQ